MANKYVCQQCGEIIDNNKMQICPKCRQWTIGITKREYISLQNALNKMFKDKEGK